jgi:hypothetical protein
MDKPTLFKTEIFAKIHKLFNLYNEMRDYGSPSISLPRIAVLGAQSSGKSSLL